jgi:putative oxidoreductase
MQESTLAKIARYILGLALIFFGSNGFLMYMTPPELSARGMEFFGALVATGYMMPFMNITFLIVAIMLLSNRYVSFGLVLLAPITLNVLLFHLFLDIATGLFGLIVGIVHIYLMIVHADGYRSMFYN